MEKDYKLAVFIGRFQPFHKGHLKVAMRGLELADKLLVIVGSSESARNIKNPFTAEEREKMIWNSLSPVDFRLTTRHMRDYYYSDDVWIANVQAIVSEHSTPGDQVVLMGNFKDAGSFFLNLFPQWDVELVKPAPNEINGTDIRDTLFNVPFEIEHDGIAKIKRTRLQEIQLKEDVPKPVFEFLKEYKETMNYAEMLEEYKHVSEYKASWDSAPFPPTFVTVDAVVICSGHVLVIKRGFNPGKGLYALPGGFIKPNETIENAMLRELKEETGIRVDKIILKSEIRGSRVFDYPDRSLRGRTITHAFHIGLNKSILPEIKASSDAEGAQWMPLMDVIKNEREFFEDHASIIEAFINVGS